MLKILRPTGGRGRRALSGAVLSAFLLSLVVALPTQAVHDTGRFQLDGDASSSTQPGNPPVPAATDDWDKVCHEATGSSLCGTTSNTTGATAVSWTGDCPIGQSGIGCQNLNSTIFTGGGSKDPIDISSWSWKDGAGGLPSKDNLLHAFAARYSLPPDATHCPSGSFSTCDVVFFGEDRYDNSGDAQNGFWFLQNKVGLVSGKSNSFSGVHKNGDLLVVSDFSIGGTTATITVYKWDSACTAAGKPDGTCADSNLRQLETSASATCSTSLATPDAFCGITNPADGTAVPWSSDFTDKSGNNTYLKGEFYESGINLSTLGLAGECFSSVITETRSSTSTTATLKDFVLGNFAVCAPTMTTSASNNGTVLPGSPVHDTATLQVSGTGDRADPTGTVTFSYCYGATLTPDCNTAPLTGIGTGTLGDAGENPTTPLDGRSHADSPDVNTPSAKLAPGNYCFFASWPGDSNYPGALTFTDQDGECFIVQDTSSITTAQDWLPNDTATLVTGGGSPLNGSLVFTLYDSAVCTGTALYTEPTITLTNAASGVQKSTTNTTVKVSASKTVSWQVVFTSTDPNIVGSTSNCETTQLVIAN